jgi:hypothetical protein
MLVLGDLRGFEWRFSGVGRVERRRLDFFGVSVNLDVDFCAQRKLTRESE